MMSKNLTLAVPATVLDRFRLHALERKTTVNALVRRFMEDTVGLEDRRREAIDRMLELSDDTQARIDMRSWDRAASYERNA